MRMLVAAALYCFLVAVIVGSAVGDEGCPLETGELADLPFYRKVPQFAKSCSETLQGNTSALQGHHVTTETIQDYFKTMCAKVPAFEECLEQKASSLEVCANRNILNSFDILRDAMVTTVRTGCAEGGKLFVTLVEGFVAIANTNPIHDQVIMCAKKSSPMFAAIENTKVDVASKFFIMYKELSQFVECTSHIHFEESLREGVDHYFNLMTTTLKCIQHEALVQCASIEVDTISAPTICQAKTHGSKVDLYDILEGDVSKCFDKIMVESADGKDIATFREEFNGYCSKKGSAEYCLKESEAIAERCLNAASRDEFKRVIENFNIRLDVKCGDGGRRLADVMYEVYRLKTAGQGHAVSDCLEVSRATRNDIDEHRSSSKSMRFYHELESFKTCLVGKLHEDQTSVDAATSLIDEMLKKLVCPGGEAGTTVTCQSLMHHDDHEHNHH